MKLLLLAGTAEARQLARRLAGEPGVQATASLAGVTRKPLDLGVPTRTGGFGGREAFAAYLRDHGIGAVVDATHPFAEAISRRSAQVCAELSLPYLQLLRPEWRAGEGDDWTMLGAEEEAAAVIPKGTTVFLATGPAEVPRFHRLQGCRLICRRIDPPQHPFPFANGEYLVSPPPFTLEGETRLFRELGVDWLVARNAGGAASWPKIEAARRLGLRVAMIRRPQALPVPRVETVEAALDWVRNLAGAA